MWTMPRTVKSENQLILCTFRDGSFSETYKPSDVGMVKFKLVSKHETSKFYDDITFKGIYIRGKHHHVIMRFVERFS